MSLTLMRAVFVVVTWLASSLPVVGQERPDLSGTWLLDAQRNGREPTIWTQTRSRRFVLKQTADDLTIGTGDGSIFGVARLVIDAPLRYPFDGSSVVAVDRSLGDLPGFERKIGTKASWDGERLVTHSTHFSETAEGASGGVTRVLVFSMMPNGTVLKVDRTGYRGTPGPELFVRILPKYLHRGILEDDLAYAKDTAYYTKAVR